MKPPDRNRRILLTLLAAASPALLSRPVAAALALTPRQTTGPFYPSSPKGETDNDLTLVDGQPPALGEYLALSGRVRDINGNALPNTRVEIWQCDANGRYHHPRDRGADQRDPGFQGFGASISNQEGDYLFRTIRPVPYPGRTPHIHVAVVDRGQFRLVTQMYVAGDSGNATDGLYQRLDEPQRALVTVPLEPVDTDDLQFQAKFDLIVG